MSAYSLVLSLGWSRLFQLVFVVLVGGTTRLPAQISSSGSDSIAHLAVYVVRDSLTDRPVSGAIVRIGQIKTRTDSTGRSVLQLPAGSHMITISQLGFRPETLTVALRPAIDTTVRVLLEAMAGSIDGILVTATRSTRRVEDEPLRVERIEGEEIEEKVMMTPGDVTMMLNETSGLRVQTTSPSLGAANIRVQGLRGRYTQILSDGLPLYGGQTGGLGLLQIPPMDLGGVDIIKGVASALYGGSALGGVINLTSRRPPLPGEASLREVLLNQTTQQGTDAVGFVGAALSPQWGYTLLAGAHRQRQTDRDRDGWTDLAGYERAVMRPRFYWNSSAGHNATFTLGTTLEDRNGGTMPHTNAPDGQPYPERLRTHRYDAGSVTQTMLGNVVLTIRGAAAWQQHRHTFGPTIERDRHLTWFGETALTAEWGHVVYVVGAALNQESYRARDISHVNYTFTTPGLFAQATIEPQSWIAVTASGRIDRHSEYGTQVAPRVSALLRVAPMWTVRLSGGDGYFAPTPFIEETEATGLTPLTPPNTAGMRLVAERGRSGSADLGGVIQTPMGPVEVNATLFGSVIRRPVSARNVVSQPGLIELVNLQHPMRTWGTELLGRWKPEPFHVTASYTLTYATEEDAETGLRRDVPLTPRHQIGIVAMWEVEGKSRVGIESYYTGRQALNDDPYRTESRPYLLLGILAERRIGPARVFINLENLTDVRQTRTERLVRPTQGFGRRWTTDVWAPLEGRIINAGVRWEIGSGRE